MQNYVDSFREHAKYIYIGYPNVEYGHSVGPTVARRLWQRLPLDNIEQKLSVCAREHFSSKFALLGSYALGRTHAETNELSQLHPVSVYRLHGGLLRQVDRHMLSIRPGFTGSPILRRAPPKPDGVTTYGTFAQETI